MKSVVEGVFSSFLIRGERDKPYKTPKSVTEQQHVVTITQWRVVRKITVKKRS